jgi:5-methylcytosine-specific restriction endonuclease McrA
MRIPTDTSLAAFINRLIQEGNIYKFYKTKEWMELRLEVLQDKHYECQHCLDKGKYKRAECVHHINEVKHRPDLALSKKYIDIQGNEHDNLIPLCNQCHNEVHDRVGSKKKYKFNNKERW